MKQRYKAIVKQEGEWWFGWIEEIPGVNCQERTKEELLQTLRETLREARTNACISRASPAGDLGRLLRPEVA
jgi:hypothetical protein